MEFPFGHHTHRHHHQRNDPEDEQPPFDQPPQPRFNQPSPPSYYPENEFAHPPPPPPPYYQENEFAPPPPSRPPPPPYYQETEYAPTPPPPSTNVTHLHHTSDQQEFNSFNYQQPAPPSPPTQVSHVAHEVGQESETSHYSLKPHLPSFLHSHHDVQSASASNLSNRPTVKVYCKAQPNFSLTIREKKVILAPSDPSDEFQKWYKDEKYSTRVKDEEGYPCFALVNKATGQAMKHSVGASHPVQLIPYNPDVLDESILWSESKDLGDGYKAVRMINNIRLNLDAFHGDKKSGGIHDGTTIVLWQWNKGDNQLWKINPHCNFLDSQNAWNRNS